MLLIWQWCYRNTMIARACFVNTFGVASCCSTCALTNDLSYVTEKQHFLERLSLETTNFLCTSWTFQFCLHSHAGLSTPHVYWWWVGDRWRNNGGHMTSFWGEKKARKRCCFNCNIWPNWFTSQARSRGRGRRARVPPEISRLELNSATKVEFFY